jgi:hypothetical protein
MSISTACTLLILQTTVALTDTGWRESVDSRLSATPTCTSYDIALPPGVTLGEHRAHIAFGDGTRKKVEPMQWETHPRTLGDDGSVRIHLPELLGGDAVRIRYERIWSTNGPFIWTPGTLAPLHAEIRAATSLDWESQGVDCEQKGSCWASEPNEEARVVLRGPSSSDPVSTPHSDLLPPSRPVDIQRRLTIGVPPGDPQLRLYPGGGAIQHWEQFLVFEAEDRQRGLLVPLPSDHDALDIVVEPRDGIEIVIRPDGVLLVVAPSEGPARAALSYDAPDAPTFGEVPEGETLEVEARNGRIKWDGRTWWLSAIHGKPILPSRKALEAALDYRFRSLSIPQPGIPNELRGRKVDWTLIGDLRPTLSARARPATWPSDPLFPRKLIRARNSGAVSETEAALTVWLYAKELAIDAQWVLVRPASTGPGYLTSPAGYDRALVLVGHEQTSRWIDPSCLVCGPFEVRPDLEGASALGGGLTQTRAPSPGVWITLIGGDAIRWNLTGSAALSLRLWLQTLPEPDRLDALAGRIAGPHATLIDATGIEEPGAPIQATAKREAGVFADPLSLPPLRTDQTAWVETVGERWVRWAGRTAADSRFDGEAIQYQRYTEGSDLVEILTVKARQIGADDIAGLQRAREASSTAPALANDGDSAQESPSEGDEQPNPGEGAGEDQRARRVGTGSDTHQGGVSGHEDNVKDSEEPR